MSKIDANGIRQPSRPTVLVEPGDFVEIVSVGPRVLGRHTYRVELDGKLRRSSGSRHEIAENGEGEGLVLPPLYENGKPKSAHCPRCHSPDQGRLDYGCDAVNQDVYPTHPWHTIG